jgi:DNA-binding NarL/FixJ family response regulator
MKPKLKVLLIEDNPGDARLIQEMLSEAKDILFELECVDRLSAGFEFISAGGIDIVLLDLSLPDSEGLETLTKTHTSAPEVPIIVLTGLDDKALGFEAVRKGAQDYLTKGEATTALLSRAIRYAVERNRLLDQLEEARERERRDKELRSFERLGGGSPGSSVTARMYGVVTLQDGFPETFRKLTDSYEALMDLALEQQAYKVRHDISGRLGAMSETLGFYKAGPRDVVDIHTTALKAKTRKAATMEKRKAYTGEGWIMVLELMGQLASFYRNRTQGVSASIQKHKKNSENKNIREEEDE